MWVAWLAALVILAVRRLRRRDIVPGPAPGRTHEQLRQAARNGDLWAAFALARRRHVRSVTELVMLVFPDRSPTTGEADVLLDAWHQVVSEREDDERRRHAILG